MASQDNSLNQFSLLIAYVVPGFIALWGVSYFSPEVRIWIGHAPADAPTLGGFLYMTVASIVCGLVISTVRWMLIDTLHHATGLARPAMDFSQFHEHVVAYTTLNEIHYRYYQFNANSLISVVWLYVARRISLGVLSPLTWTDAGFVLVAMVLFVGSRDTLKKFYSRMGQVLQKRDFRRRGS